MHFRNGILLDVYFYTSIREIEYNTKKPYRFEAEKNKV